MPAVRLLRGVCVCLALSLCAALSDALWICTRTAQSTPLSAPVPPPCICLVTVVSSRRTIPLLVLPACVRLSAATPARRSLRPPAPASTTRTRPSLTPLEVLFRLCALAANAALPSLFGGPSECMRTAPLRARPLEPASVGRPPLAVLIVGLCVIWCWNLLERTFFFIQSVLWPPSAQWMSDPRPSSSRRFSWLGSLLCFPSDSAMMDPSNNTPSRRNRLIPVAAGSPPHWDPIDPAHGNTSLVLLSKDNPKHVTELAQVEESWTRTQGAGKIVTVHRVQNLTLWSAYEAMKAELQQSGSLVKADAIVYHGTRHHSPALIHAGAVGFDPSLGTSSPGRCWFAANASWSSSLYGHAVPSSSVPFDGSAAAWIWKPYKQIFQAQLTLTARQSTGQVTTTAQRSIKAPVKTTRP